MFLFVHVLLFFFRACFRFIIIVAFGEGPTSRPFSWGSSMDMHVSSMHISWQAPDIHGSAMAIRRSSMDMHGSAMYDPWMISEHTWISYEYPRL